MKHDYIKKQMQNHLSKGIHDALTGTQPMVLKLTRAANDRYTPDRVRNPVRGAEGKTGGFLPKGPPGRSRSPGVGKELFPDHPPDEILTFDRVQSPVGAEIASKPSLKIRRLAELKINTEHQNMNKSQNSNYLQTLNFTIMKKQILFLAFFVLAALAGMKMSYGQVGTTVDVDHLGAVPTYCAPYVPLLCGAGDALAPMPGVEYTYTITSSSIGKLHWFVTDDANIITSQGALAATIEPSNGTSPYVLSADAAYNDPNNTSPTVKIKWKSFNGTTNNVILVVYNTNDANCTDNMEVYRIEPKYAFTLDLAGIADDGTTGGTAVTDCVNPIQSATYDGSTLTVNYGVDYIFYAVKASNWMTSWMPGNFSVATTGTSAVTVDGWAYPADAATTGAWKTVGTDPVLATSYSNNNNGFIDESCIIVRVKVDHGTTTENLTAETITLTVNGEMVDPANGTTYSGYPDLDEGGAGNACTNDLTTDKVDYVLSPRPTVAESTPTPFETKVP